MNRLRVIWLRLRGRLEIRGRARIGRGVRGRLEIRGRARIGRGVRGRLEIRGRARFGRGVRIAVAPGARVVLEDGCVLGEGCRIEANAGTVRIGPGARLGERSVVVALAGIDVGAGCVVGDWVLLADAEPTFDDPERPTRLQPLRAAPVTLGEGALIGVHAAVLTGVRPGAVVEPYAVLTEARSSS